MSHLFEMDAQSNGAHQIDNSQLLDFSTESLSKLEEVLNSDHVKQLLCDSKGFESLAASILDAEDNISASKNHFLNGSPTSNHQSAPGHVATVQEGLDLVDALDSLVTQLTHQQNLDHDSTQNSTTATMSNQFLASDTSAIEPAASMSENIFCEHSYSRPVQLDDVDDNSAQSTLDNTSDSNDVVTSELAPESSNVIISVPAPGPSQSPLALTTASTCSLNTSDPNTCALLPVPNHNASSLISESVCEPNLPSVNNVPQPDQPPTNTITVPTVNGESSNSSQCSPTSIVNHSPKPNSSATSTSNLVPSRRSQRQIERHERFELKRIKAENQELLQREKEQSELRAKQAEQLASQDSPSGSTSSSLVSNASSPVKSIESNSDKHESPGKGRSRRRTLSQAATQVEDLQDAHAVVNKTSNKSVAKSIKQNRSPPKATKVDNEVSISTCSKSPSPSFPDEEVAEDNEEEEEEDAQDGDDESGEDWASDDDPEKLWCTCRQPHNNRFMICCDQCEDWFHGTCVGVTRSQGALYEKEQRKWFCSKCRELQAEERRITSGPSKRNRVEPANRCAKPKNDKKKATMNETNRSDAEAKRSASKVAAVADREEGVAKETSKTSKNQTVSEEKKQEQALKDLIKSKKMEISRKLNNTQDDKQTEKTKKLSRHELTDEIKPINDKPEITDLATKDKSVTEDTVKDVKPKEGETVSQKLAVDVTKHTKKDEKRKKSKETELDPSFNDLFKAEPLKIQKRPSTGSLHSLSPKKSFSSSEHGITCINSSCGKSSASIGGKSPSMYCSEICLEKYVQNMIQMNRARHEHIESKAEKLGESSVNRLTVIDKRTGRYLSGPNAIAESKIFAYLKANPNYEIVLPNAKRSSNSSAGKDEKRRSSTSSASGVSANGSASSTKQSEASSESIRASAKKTLRKTLQARVDQCKEVQFERSFIKQIAYEIEDELYRFYQQVASKYKTRYRSLVFNLGDSKNQGLYRRVLSGKLKADKLVRMSPEELASPELAKWRERENRHSIEMLKRDAEQQAKQLIVKKTHKGEELIETKVQLPTFDDATGKEGDNKRKSSPINEKLITNPLDSLFKDTTAEHSQHLFDLHCKICSSKKEDEYVPTSQRKRSSEGSATDVQPNGSNNTVSNEPKRVRVELDEPTSRILEEASRIVAEEAKNEAAKPPEVKPPPELPAKVSIHPSLSAPSNTTATRSTSSCWNGIIHMQDFTRFASFAYRICGNYEPKVDYFTFFFVLFFNQPTF